MTSPWSVRAGLSAGVRGAGCASVGPSALGVAQWARWHRRPLPSPASPAGPAGPSPAAALQKSSLGSSWNRIYVNKDILEQHLL